MPQPPNIRVRKGAGRPHRINLALDRLRERAGPTTLRVVVQANLPRGQGRPSRLQYQRVGSWLIDCQSPADVAHVRSELANLMGAFPHPNKDEQRSTGQEATVESPALGDAEVDPELKRVFQRVAEIRGQAAGNSAESSVPRKPVPRRQHP